MAPGGLIRSRIPAKVLPRACSGAKAGYLPANVDWIGHARCRHPACWRQNRTRSPAPSCRGLSSRSFPNRCVGGLGEDDATQPSGSVSPSYWS